TRATVAPEGESCPRSPSTSRERRPFSSAASAASILSAGSLNPVWTVKIGAPSVCDLAVAADGKSGFAQERLCCTMPASPGLTTKPAPIFLNRSIDPPPLNATTLKYGFDHEGGPQWQTSDTS